MSQRATQHSTPEFLSANTEDLRPRKIAQYKRKTRLTEAHPASDDDTAIPLPEQRPATSADIDPIVHTTGNAPRTAHIAACGGDEPEPLCVAMDEFPGVARNWVCKPRNVYPDPDAWFDEICGYCQSAHDRMREEWR